MQEVLVLTVSGDDQPGVTAGLTTALSELPVVVRQLEQIVLQGHLVLGIVLSPQPGNAQSVLEQAEVVTTEFATTRGMHIATRRMSVEQLSQWTDRLVVTVLGKPLVPSDISTITARIAQHGGNIDRIRQVAQYPVTAVEFEVGGVEKWELRESLAAVARENKIDIAVQEAGLDRRGNHLVVMDVDSTVIQNEVIDLLAAKAGVEAQVADITHRAMNGELDFEESLRARVALLAGLPTEVFEQVRNEVELTPGAQTMVRTLHRLGYQVALVSGGFHEVVDDIASTLDIEHVRANRLEVKDGVLTGELRGPIIDRKMKALALKDLAEQYSIPLGRTVAIGDGANDLDMLHTAGLGIAFNAKPFVRDSAHASVNTPYLDTVLYLLGITREQIERSDAAAGVITPAPEV